MYLSAPLCESVEPFVSPDRHWVIQSPKMTSDSCATFPGQTYVSRATSVPRCASDRACMYCYRTHPEAAKRPAPPRSATQVKRIASDSAKITPRSAVVSPVRMVPPIISAAIYTK